jgi:hypothetical protein
MFELTFEDEFKLVSDELIYGACHHPKFVEKWRREGK